MSAVSSAPNTELVTASAQSDLPAEVVAWRSAMWDASEACDPDRADELLTAMKDGGYLDEYMFLLALEAYQRKLKPPGSVFDRPRSFRRLTHQQRKRMRDRAVALVKEMKDLRFNVPISTQISLSYAHSNVGRKAIPLNPANSQLFIYRAPDNRIVVRAQGRYGSIIRFFDDQVHMVKKDNRLQLWVDPSLTKREARVANQYFGLYRTLISNMLKDTTRRVKRFMRLVGIGFKVYKKENTLYFSLGFTHLVIVPIPPSVYVKILDKKHTKFVLIGTSVAAVTDFRMKLRILRRPNVYTGKGMRFRKEQIQLKEGKKKKQ